jgi:hypothetical protein
MTDNRTERSIYLNERNIYTATEGKTKGGNQEIGMRW